MDEVGDVEESPWLSFQRETAMLAARSKTFETIDRMREQGIQRERTYFSPYTIDLSTNPGFLKDLTEFERQNVTGISEIVKAERLQATVRTWEDRTPVLYCCPRCYGLFGYLPDLRPHFQKCIGKYENPEGLKWSDMWVMPVKYERPKPYMKWLVDCNEEKKRAHGSYGNDATAASTASTESASYEQLLEENAALRTRISELEGVKSPYEDEDREQNHKDTDSEQQPDQRLENAQGLQDSPEQQADELAGEDAELRGGNLESKRQRVSYSTYKTTHPYY